MFVSLILSLYYTNYPTAKRLVELLKSIMSGKAAYSIFRKLQIISMKKLEVVLLVSSIKYFDHFQVKNYAGNGFEKSLSVK